MSDHSIPVDLFNPGQVFACLGFLEAAEILIGDTEGRFDWSQSKQTRFHINGPFAANPFRTVLESLANGAIREIYPEGWRADEDLKKSEVFPSLLSEHVDDKGKSSTTKLPGTLDLSNTALTLSSWTDGSSRADFKLYSGNRSGCSIAVDMVLGKRGKPKKGKAIGEILNRGIRQLVEADLKAVISDPFNVTTPMAGSFNMDPRGAWNSLDAGYSPNEHGDDVAASPVVEFLATFALEHFRPSRSDNGAQRYTVWNVNFPPILARVALSGLLPLHVSRRFAFQLAYSGKNKIVTFAEESH